jgi:hypothetical protein
VTIYRVPNHLEVFEFDGQLISSASTERTDDPRWTELNIYRTDSGRYVIHRVGKSVVYHARGGPCNFGVATPGEDLPDDAEPCRRCRPPATDDPDFNPRDHYELEQDFHSAVVCTGPEVPQRLTRRGENRATGAPEDFMSSVSRRALQGAIDHDPDLRAAVTSVRRVG